MASLSLRRRKDSRRCPRLRRTLRRPAQLADSSKRSLRFTLRQCSAETPECSSFASAGSKARHSSTAIPSLSQRAATHAKSKKPRRGGALLLLWTLQWLCELIAEAAAENAAG